MRRGALPRRAAPSRGSRGGRRRRDRRATQRRRGRRAGSSPGDDRPAPAPRPTARAGPGARRTRSRADGRYALMRSRAGGSLGAAHRRVIGPSASRPAGAIPLAPRTAQVPRGPAAPEPKMPSPLPVFRPLLLAVALPITALACLAALGPSPRREAPSLPAAPAAGPWVWVSNEGSGDLAVIDAATDEVVARVHVGKRPRVSPAYASAADRGADGIAEVDLATRRLSRVLPSGQDPAAFDVVAGGRLLVISNEETASASIVDVATARLVGSVAVGEEPEGVTAAPDGRLVAVTSEREHRVDFVDPGAGRAVARVPTCLRPRSIAFTRDGALAFAPCEEGAAVAVIDARALRPAGEIVLPAGSRPMGIALAADGRRLFVSNGRAGTVSAIDVASRKVVATSPPFGQRVWGLGLTPDGRRLYVADGPANEVVVLDATTLAVLRRIPVGDSPWGVVIAP